jgi:hypothetical protein
MLLFGLPAAAGARPFVFVPPERGCNSWMPQIERDAFVVVAPADPATQSVRTPRADYI